MKILLGRDDVNCKEILLYKAMMSWCKVSVALREVPCSNLSMAASHIRPGSVALMMCCSARGDSKRRRREPREKKKTFWRRSPSCR